MLKYYRHVTEDIMKSVYCYTSPIALQINCFSFHAMKFHRHYQHSNDQTYLFNTLHLITLLFLWPWSF
jgi:hypothetical protein